MKFKKFLMTLACMVLVVGAALGFAGCDKDVSTEDVKTFIQSAEVDGAFDSGYSMKTTGDAFGLNGDMEVKVLFNEDGELSAAYLKSADVGEVWLKESVVYVNNGKTKVRCALEALPTELNEVKEGLEDLKANVEDFDVESLIEGIEELDAYKENGSFKISLKKNQSGNRVTFKINVSGTDDKLGISMTSNMNIAFDSNKLAKVSTTMKMGKMETETTIEAFSGEINLPSDAASYVDYQA